MAPESEVNGEENKESSTAPDLGKPPRRKPINKNYLGDDAVKSKEKSPKEEVDLAAELCEHPAYCTGLEGGFRDFHNLAIFALHNRTGSCN